MRDAMLETKCTILKRKQLLSIAPSSSPRRHHQGGAQLSGAKRPNPSKPVPIVPRVDLVKRIDQGRQIAQSTGVDLVCKTDASASNVPSRSRCSRSNPILHSCNKAPSLRPEPEIRIGAGYKWRALFIARRSDETSSLAGSRSLTFASAAFL